MLSPELAAIVGARIKEALDAADPPVQRGDGRTMDSDEAAVRAFLQQLTERMNARDGAGLVREHWIDSHAASLIPAHSDTVAGRAAIQETYVRSVGALRDARVRFHDERVVVFAGGQAACVTALLDSDLVYAESGRRASNRNVRVSLSLEKQDRAWRVLSAHYSVPVGAHPGGAK
jgi:uncharacterized protein (TIGR02246 family)